VRRFSLAIVSLVAAALLAGPALAARAHSTATAVTVTATEFKFKLSKASVPHGKVTFTLVNKGNVPHDFKIAGKKTKLLNPGKSQALTVTFNKKGTFAYICTVTGHARLGMKGNFGVGVSAPPPPATTTTTPTTTGNVGNATTTVTVNMVEYAFQLSQPTIPSGQVTFIVKNSGAEVHNFDINGVKSGALLAPGASETWTVALPPGQFLYTCDVPFHVDRGMTGTFQVTP
jgi:uncharacterized cupredoxin-like copper-binding protein